MPKNDFKPFAISDEANVLKQSEYESLPALAEGFQSGIARSEELNKVWRQASTIASVIASFMANKSGKDVIDDGDLNKLQSTLLEALLNNSVEQLDGRYLNAEQNLKDLGDTGAARSNLGLGDIATHEAKEFVKTSGGDVGYLNNAAHYGVKQGNWEGAGSFAGQLSDPRAPFMIPMMSSPAGQSIYYPMIKSSTQTQGAGYQLAASFGVVVSGNHEFPRITIHGTTDASTGGVWVFDPNNGAFTSPGEVIAGGAKLGTNGDVMGTLWGGWLSTWLNRRIQEVQNWAVQSFVLSVRLGSKVFVNPSNNDGYASITAPPGHVLTAILDRDTSRWPMPDSPDHAYACPVQVLINGQWITVGQA